jgi:hypothetical protein
MTKNEEGSAFNLLLLQRFAKESNEKQKLAKSGRCSVRSRALRVVKHERQVAAKVLRPELRRRCRRSAMLRVIIPVVFLVAGLPLTAFAQTEPQPVARNFVLVIDRDDSPAPTPINTAYWNAITATRQGDEILAFQRYFRNERINAALIAAAARKVQVKAIYREALDPPCSSLLPSERTLCDGIFVQSSLPHHKNMMILHSGGTAHAVIGSYNPRERTLSEPRIHTVLTFDIVNGGSVFDYYRGEADRLLRLPTTQPLAMSVDVEGGGIVQLQMHPADAHPMLDMLNAITTCESPLWMSFYGASNSTISTRVYDRLRAPKDAGCDVRVLLYADNADARCALEARGVPVQFPTYPVGTALLGHKLLMVRSGSDLHLIQSSANLNQSQGQTHNLTLYLRAPGLHTIQTELEAELNRYWR